MRAYKSDKAIVNSYTPRLEPTEDLTRAHSANYAISAALLSFVLFVLAWTVVKVFYEALPTWSILLSIAAGLVMGAVMFSLKLMSFTTELRDYLYWVEEETQRDLNRDGVIGDPESVMKAGLPPQGSMIRGIDGQFHRINTELSLADLHAVKAAMLTSGTFGTRVVNGLLGDETRASGLRVELYRLNILERPQPRQATPLTPEGIKAVRRWN